MVSRKKVFAMFSNEHHGDGHLAVMVPAESGVQEALMSQAPRVYYRPAYVGVRGWVGIELGQIGDDDLAGHLQEAWRRITPTKLVRGSSRG